MLTAHAETLAITATYILNIGIKVREMIRFAPRAAIPEYKYILVFLFPRRIEERIGLNEKKGIGESHYLKHHIVTG